MGMQQLATDIDHAQLITVSMELGELIRESQTAAAYQYWKQQLAADEEAQAAIQHLSACRDRFLECERFGHYHPDYHEALQAWETAIQRCEAIPSWREFKRAEAAMDQLLHAVSELIAHSVSKSIKVPSDLTPSVGGGCGSGNCAGGSCNGGCV